MVGGMKNEYRLEITLNQMNTENNLFLTDVSNRILNWDKCELLLSGCLINLFVD